MTERMEQPNQEKSEHSERSKFKNTWVYWKRTQVEMNEKKNEHLRRTTKLLEAMSRAVTLEKQQTPWLSHS